MTCWFCKHVLALASLRATDTNTPEHRRQWACVHCGAQFECVERLISGPSVTDERLALMRIQPR